MPSPRLFPALLAALALAGAATPSIAQSPAAQPYAGLQHRPVKSLSADDIAALTAGNGMGLALAAELNGYPGPRHVLDLADPLALTAQQRSSIQGLFDTMKAEAIPLGQKLITAETELDREFANRTITAERLQQATAGIAAIRGALRNAHLKYHLATAALLTAEQIRRYAELRGYADGASPQHPHGGAGHMHDHRR